MFLLDAVDFDEILASSDRKTGAFDYRAKAFVLKNVAAATLESLRRRGYAGFKDALSAYESAALSIYRFLAEMGGDVSDKALFFTGASRWEAGDVEGAFAAWRRIGPAFKTLAFRVIKPYLGSNTKFLEKGVTRIDNALFSESASGNNDLLKRQLRFHKWANRVAAWKKPEK